MRTALYRTTLISVILLATAITGGGVANAQTSPTWNFDTCDASTVSEVEGMGKKPAIMLMLDRSGSMNSCGSPGCAKSRWEVAVDAINTTVGALAHKMDFGLGFFSGGLGSQQTLVSIDLEATDFEKAKDISDILKDNDPWGGTPTWEAIKEIRTSDTLKLTDRSVAGVLITDGYPSSGLTEPIEEACKMREARQNLFVVGFSNGTDTRYNDKVAAAGGMAYTDQNDNFIEASCSNGDPCDQTNLNKSQCRGSIQANNQDEFQNALDQIVQEMECRFPVDLSLHPEGEVPLDPSALRVRLFGNIDVTGRTIPHRSHSPDQEGWYYPNPTNPEEIRLTDYYCDLAIDGDIDAVETTMACPCTDTEGQECVVRNASACACIIGQSSCDNGYAICEPLPVDECPSPCPREPAGLPCHIDNNAETTSQDKQALDIAAEKNRCKIGVLECEGDQLVCTQIYRAMPEICNGLDNDCDGAVGNISQSWSRDWSHVVGAGYTPKDVACYGEDLCRCQNSIGTHGGTGTTPQEEYQSYLNHHEPGTDSGGCICVEN